MTETKEILNPNNPDERKILVEERALAVHWRTATALSQSNVIPKAYQNNIANCMVAQEMATRMGIGSLEVMQNLDVINGKPSFSSKYLIARINTSGLIKGRLRFEFEDLGTKELEREYTQYVNNKPVRKKEKGVINDKKCRALATCSETGEVLEGSWISIEMAFYEGWYTKNNSKWQTMPDHMLQLRAASFWATINAPECSMGIRTQEEILDIGTEKEMGQVEVVRSDLNEMVKKAAKNEELGQETDKNVRSDEEEPGKESEAPESKEEVESKNEEEKQGNQPDVSKGYDSLREKLQSCKNEDDLDELIKSDDWDNLNEGEVFKLQAGIEMVRASF